MCIADSGYIAIISKLRELGFTVFVPDSKAAVDQMMVCMMGAGAS